jgi:SAM-dependent methyltransferase
MLTLLGYPLLLEPWAPTRSQAWGWSIGYGIFIALCIATGWTSLRRATNFVPVPIAATPAAQPLARKSRQKRKRGDRATASAELASPVAPADSPPKLTAQLFWALLAGTGTFLLLAVTNHITQNIASVPLLWILPLAIYLLTFILSFEWTGWYRHSIFITLLGIALATMGFVLANTKFEYMLRLHVGVFCLGLFVGCMFCRGELARRKPAPKYLTRFYLMIALGGAAGSALVGIVAPLVLPAYFELAGGLVLVACLAMWQVRHDHIGLHAIGFASVVVTLVCGLISVQNFYDSTVSATRNFYGVLRVREGDIGSDRRRELMSGSIQHGIQYLEPRLARYPTSYYVPTSGIGRLLSTRPGGFDFAPRRVGVIGLGIGTLAAYGLRGDTYRFYEINPEVFTIAQRDFSYLKDSAAQIEFSPGDARLALEPEPNQNFDVLVVDAFLGDAIPVHLITKEAVGVYLRHLRPGGVLAVHVSNRYLDLVPVVAALADANDLHASYIIDKNQKGPSYASQWVLLSARQESLDIPKLTEAATPIARRPDWPVWTDDFNNIIQVLM